MKNEVEFLPKGWAWASVSELARYVTSGSRDWSGFYSDTGALFIRTQDINTNTLRWRESASVQLPQSIEGKRALVTVGDMLITITGANVGKCALVEDELPEAYVSQSVALVKWAEPVIGNIARLACLRPMAGGQTVLQELAYGLGRPVLSLKQIRELQLPIPPLGEQRRIVALTEALQKRTEKARSALDAIPPLLEKFRRSVLAAAFRGDLTREWRARNPDVEPASVLLERIRAERKARFIEDAAEKARARAEERARKAGKGWGAKDDARVLEEGRAKAERKYVAPEPVDEEGFPELPEGWCWARVEELAWDSGYGTSQKCDEKPNEAPVLRIPNIRGEALDLSDLKYATQPEALSLSDQLRRGDLLFVRTNGSQDLIGRAALIEAALPSPVYFASYLIRLRLVGVDAVWKWISFAWKSEYLRHQIRQASGSSAGQFNLSMNSALSFAVPLAPLPEMESASQLLNVYQERIAPLGRICGALSSNLESLDQSVIAKAFRGELVRQNPNDEPASVLLDRIRAKRAAAEANGKPSRKSTRAPRPKTTAPKRGPARKKAPA